MSDTELVCNSKKCRKRIISHAWVTSCSHVFCEDDGENQLLKQATMKCPACNSSLPNPLDVVKVDLNPSEQFKGMVLAGLRPDIIMDVASRAISFWNYQVRLEHAYQENSIKTSREQLTQLQVSYEALVAKIKSEVTGLKRQIEASKKEIAIQSRKAEELSEKLEEKNRQYQKLHAMYDSMRCRAIPSTIMEPPRTETNRIGLNSSFTLGPRTLADVLNTSTGHLHRSSSAERRLNQSLDDGFQFRPMTPSTAHRRGQGQGDASVTRSCRYRTDSRESMH